MKERDKVLLKSWLGEVTLDGKPLRPIGAGQAVVLKALGNACVTDGKEPSPDDMVEIIMVMAMSRDDIAAYIGKEPDERGRELAKFAAYHIDEIDGVIGHVTESLTRLGNSVMESDGLGKGDTPCFLAQVEAFAIRSGLSAERLIWETDMARLMQLMYCEAARHGSTLRYVSSIESEETNRKQKELEGNIERWLSEQQ